MTCSTYRSNQSAITLILCTTSLMTVNYDLCVSERIAKKHRSNRQKLSFQVHFAGPMQRICITFTRAECISKELRQEKVIGLLPIGKIEADQQHSRFEELVSQRKKQARHASGEVRHKDELKSESTLWIPTADQRVATFLKSVVLQTTSVCFWTPTLI